MAFFIGGTMHETFMNEAINEAYKAYLFDEVPVGAVIVYENQIISRAYNLRERTQNPMAHAEVLAIEEASKVLGTWKLNECTLYVTLEPCIMCAGSIIQSRIGTVVYGAEDNKGGAMGEKLNILDIAAFNHKPTIIKGILEQDCTEILKQFFKERREKQVKIKRIETETEFNDAKYIRNTVFVEEQAVDANIEYDAYDDINRNDVIHILAKIQDKSVATLRLILIDKKVKVGRVAVLKEFRKQGIGLKMMAYAERYACNNGFDSLELGAQVSAIPFYEASGYEAYGDIFLDADIDHKMMKKKCRR